jgi:hypothetical protein
VETTQENTKEYEFNITCVVGLKNENYQNAEILNRLEKRLSPDNQKLG